MIRIQKFYILVQEKEAVLYNKSMSVFHPLFFQSLQMVQSFHWKRQNSSEFNGKNVAKYKYNEKPLLYPHFPKQSSGILFNGYIRFVNLFTQLFIEL